MLKKLGAALGDVFDFNALAGAGRPEHEEEEEEDGAPKLHTAVRDGKMQGDCRTGRLKGLCVLSLLYTSGSAIAKGARGPTPPAVTKAARWNRIWVVFGMQ